MQIVDLDRNNFAFKNRGNWRVNILVLLFFAVLTIIFTYPLILYLNSRIPGVQSSDNFAYLWKMYWFKHAIIDLRQSPLFAPHIFYPKGFNFAQDEATFVNTLGLLPVTWAFGEIVSLNIAVLLSFMLSGFGMYLFARELTNSIWAGVFAGVVFAFSPYHFARAFQHLNLATIQWIPFAFLFLERLINKPNRKRAVALAIFYLLTAISSWYYAYYIGIMLAIYAFIRIRQIRGQDRLVTIKMLLISGLLAVFLVMPFLYPSLALHKTGTMVYKLVDVDSYSASVDDFLRPSPFHPLWGEAIKAKIAEQFTDWGEHILFVGIIVFILMLIGLKQERSSPQSRALIWVGISALILALGTTLHIFGIRVEFGLPQLFSGWTPRGRLPVPMPGYLLFKCLPFFNSSRVWARFGLMAGFSACVFAGFGLRSILKKGTPVRRAMIGSTAIALACFEFLALPFPTSPVAPRPVDIWLRGLNEKAIILQWPDFSAGPQMYYSKHHGQYLANGCGAFLDPQFNINMYAMRGLPAGDSIKTLRAMKVKYVLLNESLYGKDWPQMKMRMDAEQAFVLRYDDGEIAVYELQ